MADSVTAAADTEPERPKAPWWAWGFVASMPFSLLTFVTPWFDAVPPKLNVWGDDQHVSYTAWTKAEIGIIAPIFLTMVGIQWLGARRRWWRPPAPGDWRGSNQAISAYLGGGGRVLPSSTGPSRPIPEPRYPFRAGSTTSMAVALGALVLLGLNRMAFSPTYSVLRSADGFEHGSMRVHAAIGCWFFLISVALILLTGAIGALVPEGDSLVAESAPPIRDVGLYATDDE